MTDAPPVSAARRLRTVFGAFPSGVTALAAHVDGRPMGMVASSFTSVSLDPPLVSVCIGTGSATWPTLSKATLLGVSVLGETHQDACLSLSAKDSPDRFAELDWHATAEGAVLLSAAAAWFVCSIHRVVPAGDHDIVVLSLHDYGRDTEVGPLVFHGGTFRKLAS
ncbi:flavin reductase family protein [Actinoallomurus purpureus]|uniref:flavin reductase family protein n=1 Tax=Actinoallomurus purpureus TaxID=478114 RepID=UPI0020922975|nr:flavin reductase family protein [Actinoallomurus purpureus]MCO6008459.1 flavin reductase family protein [Actinoallomurus purpureus]